MTKNKIRRVAPKSLLDNSARILKPRIKISVFLVCILKLKIKYIIADPKNIGKIDSIKNVVFCTAIGDK